MANFIRVNTFQRAPYSTLKVLANLSEWRLENPYTKFLLSAHYNWIHYVGVKARLRELYK